MADDIEVDVEESEDPRGEMEVRVYPDIDPKVDTPERRRYRCFSVALENVPNVGGKPVLEAVREAIQAAEIMRLWLEEGEVPEIPKEKGGHLKVAGK